MISAYTLSGDTLLWLLVIAGPLVAFLLFRMLGRPAKSKVVEAIEPTPIVPDLMPVPTQRVGIPPTALVRIQEACGGHIKDGELDIRFELRSRRDCDKMLEVMKQMKADLARTKAVFNQAEAGIRAQLDGAVAGKNTSRIGGLFGRSAANLEEFESAKRAELEGYEIATRLIDKFTFELGAAEVSVMDLPFYANADPQPAPQHPGAPPSPSRPPGTQSGIVKLVPQRS